MTRIDLILVHGDTFRARLTVKKAGAAVDLTGYTIALLVKRDAYEPDLSAAISLLEGEGLTIDAAAGTVDFEITDEQALILSTAFPYTWRLILQEVAGAVFAACGGDTVVQPAIAAPAALSYAAPAGALEEYTATISLIQETAGVDNFVTGAGDNMTTGAGDQMVAGS